MINLHPWPVYIIRKGIFLTLLLLSAALIVAVWESAVPAAFPLLRHYSLYYQQSALIVLAASLLGSLLLEDIIQTTAL